MKEDSVYDKGVVLSAMCSFTTKEDSYELEENSNVAKTLVAIENVIKQAKLVLMNQYSVPYQRHH